LTIDEKKIYFACDTALFSDMQLIGRAGIDVAVLPIGDLFTMGIEDSVLATGFIDPKQVLPTHYNTWPPIEADTALWSKHIKTETGAHPVVLEPGETHTI
jgi:L-ascorbate metabolism protein UlaG (beta-lactamase superfamily)